MPSLSGIDFYKSARQDTMVIFTTTHSQYAVEGFDLSAVDYLLKPYTFERFAQAVNKANDYYHYVHPVEQTDHPYLYIHADYSLIKINRKDILFIEGLDDYLKIHIQDQKTIVARMTLKTMLEKLPPQEFIRMHRSFIVPFSRIEQVRGKHIGIAGQKSLLAAVTGTTFSNNSNRLCIANAFEYEKCKF